jgi:hypothetical protein
MIPRLMCFLSGLLKSSGADPFLDGEHTTSWQKHDHDETLSRIKGFIEKNCNNLLEYESYSQYTKRVCDIIKLALDVK